MKKNIAVIALAVLVAIVAFACGTMVTEVEAQSSERKYIGIMVVGSYVKIGSEPSYRSRDNGYVVYEENGVIKKETIW